MTLVDGMQLLMFTLGSSPIVTEHDILTGQDRPALQSDPSGIVFLFPNKRHLARRVPKPLYLPYFLNVALRLPCSGGAFLAPLRPSSVVFVYGSNLFLPLCWPSVGPRFAWSTDVALV